MISFLVNRNTASVFYLFVMVVDHWGFWVGHFYVRVSGRIFKLY